MARGAQSARVAGARVCREKRMSRANDAGAAFAIIIGDDELARSEVQLKSLESGEQRAVPLDELVKAVRQ